MSEPKSELLDFLKTDVSDLKVVTMPDFFLDRLVSLEWNPEEFFSKIESVAERKGGNLDNICQMNLRGGNAVNVASALAKLGVNPIPIICTSKLGLEQLQVLLKPLVIDLSHVKIKAKSSITTALEFLSGHNKTNVMLRDLGSLEDFGPDDITENDFLIIEKANYVCVFNWAGTRKYGTSLTEKVFRRAKMKGKCKTYLNTADPTPLKEKIPNLIENVLLSKYTDIVSLNENEAVTYASYFDKHFSNRRRYEKAIYSLEAAHVLASHLNARVDLHTATFSATITEADEFIAPSFKVKVLRATGAGDSWDAGNLIGDAGELSEEGRLNLANAVAGYYLSNPEGKHPNAQQLSKFIERYWEERHQLK